MYCQRLKERPNRRHVNGENPMFISTSPSLVHLGMAAVVTRRSSLLSVYQLWTDELVAETRAD